MLCAVHRVLTLKHYLLHRGMKLLITPLLSGLLENDSSRMTEFEDFFKEIEKINRKKVKHVAHISDPTLAAQTVHLLRINQKHHNQQYFFNIYILGD